MSGDLKDMRAYSRGYEDGRRSKDAEHAAVALRLSRLCFDGGSHENLSKIAYAIYPCATGWTCESSKGLRDRLIDLLGGVRNRDGLVHRCFNACGDPGPRGVGEHAEAMTCDVLGNERHEAVCRLGEYEPRMGGKPTEEASKLIRCITGNDDSHVACANDLEETRDRLIHLLGGDVGTCPNNGPLASIITAELRDYLGENGQEYDNFKGETIASLSGGLSPIYAIADRIDEQFERERDDLLELLKDAATEYMLSQNSWNYGAVVSETITLESENNELRAKLEEADAAIANWREREKSFEESERERDELQKRLDEMREQREHWASEATKIYRLFFPHEEYGMPNEPSEMVIHKINELQAKLDAIREALDGNH